MGKLTKGIITSILIASLIFFSVPSVAEESASIASGKAIFSNNCVQCHGKLGAGDGPRAASFTNKPFDFTDTEKMKVKSPAAVFNSIKNGIRIMPSFGGKLTDPEIRDVVLFIWTLQSSDVQIAEGKETYLSSCDDCHGEVYIPKSLDLSDQDFFDSISEHLLLGSSMSDDEKWNSISYMRSIIESENGETDSAAATPPPAESKTEAAASPEQTSSPTPTPGFEALFAVVGVMSAGYIIILYKKR